jgi:hypothetical protein
MRLQLFPNLAPTSNGKSQTLLSFVEDFQSGMFQELGTSVLKLVAEYQLTSDDMALYPRRYKLVQFKNLVLKCNILKFSRR